MNYLNGCPDCGAIYSAGSYHDCSTLPNRTPTLDLIKSITDLKTSIDRLTDLLEKNK